MTELLNVVDKNDVVISRKSRSECHRTKLRHRLVQVIIRRKPLFLIQKRSREKDVFPEYYEIGISGHVLHGETYIKAAKRELKEELGIISPQLKKLGIFHLSGSENGFCTVFLLDNFTSRIRINRTEIASLALSNVLPHKLTPMSKKALKLL